jgi:hypothetical protein
VVAGADGDGLRLGDGLVELDRRRRRRGLGIFELDDGHDAVVDRKAVPRGGEGLDVPDELLRGAGGRGDDVDLLGPVGADHASVLDARDLPDLGLELVQLLPHARKVHRPSGKNYLTPTASCTYFRENLPYHRGCQAA